jgi:hypothetical protein
VCAGCGKRAGVISALTHFLVHSSPQLRLLAWIVNLLCALGSWKRRCFDSLSLLRKRCAMSLCSRTRSKHLTGAAVDNLRAATEFAEERGTPLNCAISINLSLFSGFGVSDEVRLARAQERLRHRLGRRDLELVWLWVRELAGHTAKV